MICLRNYMKSSNWPEARWGPRGNERLVSGRPLRLFIRQGEKLQLASSPSHYTLCTSVLLHLYLCPHLTLVPALRKMKVFVHLYLTTANQDLIRHFLNEQVISSCCDKTKILVLRKEKTSKGSVQMKARKFSLKFLSLAWLFLPETVMFPKFQSVKKNIFQT